jgi:predicted secreted Zn-dependent protease
VGSLRADAIPAGTSTNLTVNLHANLRYRLPLWTRYSDASKAAKAEWDKMFAKLKVHEDRHLAIAIEEADNLAQALAGRDIADIAKMVTAANRRMQSRQDDLDTDTDHGAKTGVPYGDVVLDTTIT